MLHGSLLSKNNSNYSEHLLHTHSTYNKHQPGTVYLLATVSVLNAYIIHDNQLYLNDLDTYTSCTVHEEDSVVVRHERRQTTCMLLPACYTTLDVICVYIARD